jgi:amidohydrolase
LFEWVRDVRRELHSHPELSFKEVRTTKRIREILTGLGWEARPVPGATGVVGLLRGRGPGPVVALRADIDALPIAELSEAPYRSRVKGVMHACGHDAHTAIMLGVAKKIVDTGLMSRAAGAVKLIFQPAEERLGGAKALIAKGVLEDPPVDVIMAGHMAPDLAVGRAGVFRRLGNASADRFVLDLQGRGGHGARPEECIDPIVAGAHFVTQVQSIVSRSIKPADAAVVTVGRFAAGLAANVIPETASLEGSVRALSEEVRSTLIRRLEELAAALQPAFGVVSRLAVHPGVPMLWNDPAVAARLLSAAQAVLGRKNAGYLPPVMGSEDFAFFTEQRPGAIMRLGCSNPQKGITHQLHSPHFDIDEEVLLIGANIFYEAVARRLDAKAKPARRSRPPRRPALSPARRKDGLG